tara:strand:- start:37540 stop:38454 length:915 start_codon:yes stop_codon:yes gene_type:complete
LFCFKEERFLNWVNEWVNMPHFVIPTRDTEARNKIDITDVQKIADLNTSKQPKYPIYIISKGRSKYPQTARALEGLGIDYKIVIEPTEYDEYSAVIDKERILTLPFSDLGQGSIPARNWVLDHSIANGDKRHWILDDNLNGFGYQKGGRRITTKTNGDLFRECEDFVDRYKNIKIAGIRYRFNHNYVKSPYYLNTRIYSCILMDNTIQHRWRGKYNEDTDLSLRVLKDGDCTMLFTWCYCNKAGTLSMKGGNTNTVYGDTDNRKEFAESLKEQHPDVVKVVWRYERWHHEVNYKGFRDNELMKI